MKTFKRRTMHGSASPTIFYHAVKLRKNPTEAEEFLWSFLCNKQMEGVKFRRQHPSDDYVVDFFAVELKLSIELDGGYHEEKTQKFSDNNKDLDLMSLGWTVLRYTNEEVFNFTEMVLNDIRAYIQRLREIKFLNKKN